MIDAFARYHAKRVFEETLRTTRYCPAARVLLACTLHDDEGTPVVIAQYWVETDGSFTEVRDAREEDSEGGKCEGEAQARFQGDLGV